jgi:VCBS repeat-containing protein
MTSFSVNSTAETAFSPSVTTLSDGRFVAAWQSKEASGFFRARIFDADGVPAGNDFVVNTTQFSRSVLEPEDAPSVAALPNGRFVVTWPSFNDVSGQAIRARLFNADGSAAGGDFLVSSSPDFPLNDPSVSALPDGRFVVAWRVALAGEHRIEARLFAADGTALTADFQINSAQIGNDQRDVSIAVLPDGRFVATWTDGSTDIKGRIFNTDGTPHDPDGGGPRTSDEFVVNSTTPDGQFASSVEAMSNGRFVVTWRSQESGQDDIRARVFNADGTPTSNDFVVNSSIAGNQREPSVTALADGRFMVSWASQDDLSVRARVFNADGTPDDRDGSGPLTADEFVVGDGRRSSVTTLPDGRLVAMWDTWEGNFNIGGRIIDPSAVGKSVAVFDDPSNGEDASIAATLAVRGHSVSLFGGTTAAELSAALAGKSVLVLPSLENSTDASWQSLDAAGKAVLTTFVAAGGTLVFSGDNHGRGMKAVNSAFGLGLGNTFAAPETHPIAPAADNGLYDVGDAITHTHVDADGNFFGQVHELQTDTLPSGSTLLYGTAPTPGLFSGLTAAALMPFGGGTIAYLGWDDFDRSFPGAAAWDELLHRIVENAGTPQNAPPAASNDSFTASEDTALTIAAPGVLGNDNDADGDALTAVPVAGPQHGTLTLDPGGTFTYTPHANFNGADSFTYKVNDGEADSNVATVNLTINAVNDAPVAVNDAYTLDEDTQLRVTAAGFLGNDLDVDSDMLSVSVVTSTQHGGVTTFQDGSFIYTPNANFNGTDSFTYKVSDGLGFSNIATVTLTVNPVDEPANVIIIDGTGGRDRLVVNATGADSGTYRLNGGPSVAFSGITSFAFNGLAGIDTFTINNPAGGLFAPTGGILWNGGGLLGGDQLYVLGGTAIEGEFSRETLTLTHIGASATQTIRFAPVSHAMVFDTVNEGVFTVEGTSRNDTMLVGDDRFQGQPATQVSSTGTVFNGGRGFDLDIVNKLAVVVQGREGNDFIDASAVGARPIELVLDGGDGFDQLIGSRGDDMLLGGAGADNLDGGAGRDTLDGGGGSRDPLFGRFFPDRLHGGPGDDFYVLRDPGDRATAESDRGGIDTVVSSFDLAFNVSVWANIENLELTGTEGLNGSGNDLNNRIIGNAGNNALSGLGGEDVLVGGDGADRLAGGSGWDLLTGGLGADRFVFSGANFRTPEFVFRADIITDFEDGTDLIEIAGYGPRLDSFADLSDGNIRQAGSNVVIDLGRDVSGAGVIVIENGRISQIDASDFIFT